jgi:hypothetical protein
VSNDHDDDDAPADERGFASKLWGDMAKRALMSGLGAVLTTEESLKSSLQDMKLPKEAMNYLVSQADRTKREIIEVVARETRTFLSHMEIEQMLGRALTGTTIEISTRIRILPKDGGGVRMAVDSSTAAVPSEAPTKKKKSTAVKKRAAKKK